jgi:hypothetical protein
MGIGSLSCLSRLSVLVEVVRMLNGWEEGKADEGCRLDCFVGWVPFVALALHYGQSDGSGAGVVGCHQLDRSQSACQVGRFGFAHSRARP